MHAATEVLQMTPEVKSPSLLHSMEFNGERIVLTVTARLSQNVSSFS